jgi:membrane-bound lytic murein transglycosylase D
MAKNAAEYGLEDVAPESPLQYDTIEVNAQTHLALVADLTDASMPQLLELNPALLKGVVPSGYALHVPKGSGSALSASLQMIPAERRASWRMHRVASGETLAGIAKHYGMPVSSIAAANGMKTESPITGDRLVIPVAYRAVATPLRQHAPARHRKHSPAVTHTASNRAVRPVSGE